jgi:hypothetical protein
MTSTVETVMDRLTLSDESPFVTVSVTVLVPSVGNV